MDWVLIIGGACTILAFLGLGLYHYSIWAELRVDKRMNKLAREAAEACARREAELDAMSPEDRDKAIDEWAEGLAADVADLND